MNLDVVISTFNRHASLERTLLSILKMPVPAHHSLFVTVADNKSTDATRQTVERIAPSFHGRLQYLSADRGQGKSFALNDAILATRSELIAFIDDDEELDSHWAEIVFEAFADAKLDYIGGRYEPVWEVEPPAWVHHPNTRAAIGWPDFGCVSRSFEDKSFEGLAIGGNTVIRRWCFDRVGLYSEDLGRVGKRLLGAEDSEMHLRLKAAGFRGMYLPDLFVYHHIPATRLTRRYMRSWAFWTSVSFGRILLQRPDTGPHWLGLPRWMYGQLLRSPFLLLKSLVARKPSDIFNHELTLWRFSGTFYGVHLVDKEKT